MEGEDDVFDMSRRPEKKNNHGAILVTSEGSKNRALPGRNPGRATREIEPVFWAPIWCHLLLD